MNLKFAKYPILGAILEAAEVARRPSRPRDIPAIIVSVSVI